MSWWVSLNAEGSDPEEGGPLTVTRFEEGGTYVMGGSTEVDINITYNYSPYYYKHLDKEEGLRWLNGKKAKDTVERLRDAGLSILEDECINKDVPQGQADKFGGPTRCVPGKHGKCYSEDYWHPSPMHAAAPLVRLVEWARQHPEGVWRVN